MFVPMIGAARLYGLADIDVNDAGQAGADAGTVAASFAVSAAQPPLAQQILSIFEPAADTSGDRQSTPATAAAPALPVGPTTAAPGRSVASTIPPWMLGVGGALAVWMLIKGMRR